mgnify:CR=1 FL=1
MHARACTRAGKLKKSWAGIANAIACGVMLAASFDLLHEGAPYSPMMVTVGMLAGVIFVKWVFYSVFID